MTKLKNEIIELIIKACRLNISPNEIEGDTILFGGEGLNLDSVDALQIIVAIAREYGVDVPDNDAASLTTVDRIVAFVSSHLPCTQ